MPYPILAYHNVAPMPRLALNRRLYLAPWRFALQMRTLAALGYRGVSLREGLPYLAGNKSGRIVILTFDDGYRDTLTHALPVLRRFGFSATCFLVAAELGRYNRWDTVHWEVRKALMNPGDVEHWLAAGMDIGSHTLNHPYLTRISGAEQLLESERSKRMLEATRHLASISKAVTRRWIPRLADRFFVVSNYQRAKLARDGALATHLKVLYNPIDLARFCPSAECRNAFRNRIDSSSHDIIVGFAGRLAPEKGIFVLEQALTLAMRRVARLRAVWIGEGPALERLSGKIQASAYARRHALLSYESDLSAVLPGLDLLAVPSLSLETFGRISAEAQACGVPVVCSDSGGLAETLRPGTSGHLVPAGDAYALAQQILALTCNDVLRSEMGRQAHRHAGRFCALRVARMFEAALPDADFVPAPPALHAERHEITQRP